MKSVVKLLTPQISGIVYASAGTGKTWLLISRLLRLLLDGVCPSSILAITYTNKAADEMRDRVAERILEWNTQNPPQLEASLKQIGIAEVDIQRYSKQARHLYEQLLYSSEQIQITTFHAFCQRIISLCPLQSDVPLDFQVTENAPEWQQKSIDILFSTTALADEKIATALDLLYAETHSINNVRTALVAFLNRQNDWLNYVANAADATTEADERLYHQLAIAETQAVEDIWAKIRHSVSDYSDLLSKHPTVKNKEYAECLKALSHLDELTEVDLGKLNNCIHTTTGEARQRKLTKTLINALGTAGADKLIALCDQISCAIVQLRETNNRIGNYRLNQAWYIAASCLLNIYTKLKNQHRLLDFNDLESTASKLLMAAEDSHGIQYRLASRIEHILIDEFQDTNPTQWQLLQPLLEEIAAQQGGSVFIVGDRKQSIYGFRRAEPELQSKAGRWIKQHMSGYEENMDASYRSAPPIIDFVNQVFVDSGNLPDFKKHETVRNIKGGIHIFDLFEPPPPVQPGNTDEWRNPLRTPLLSAVDARSEEAATVAQTIAQLYHNQFTVEGSDGPRPIKYSDILIIARQKTHFDLFARMLHQQHIPVISSAAAGLLNQLEVTDLLQLLAALNNPYDDLALVQVLRSPIYSLSDQHLLELNSQEGRHYFTKLKCLVDKDELWAGVYNSFTKWSALCGRLPIHDLLYTIYAQQNLISRYRASVPAEQRAQTQLHLEAFLEYVLDYDSGRYPDIARFLDHIDVMRDGEQVSVAQEQNCVQMMSIHGAKGLEAAVVFMIDCAFKLPHKDTYDVLVGWPADHQRPEYFVLVPPVQKRSKLLVKLTEDRHRRNKKEEMNLLYVALTRAKQYLFISASGKAKSTHENWYQLIKKSCDEQKTFGDNPLAALNSTTPGVVTAASESSVDLKLFSDEVPLNTVPQQIEPSSVVAIDKERFATRATSDEARQHGSMIHQALELLNRQRYDSYAAFKQEFEMHSDGGDELIDACTKEAWLLIHKPELAVLFDKTRYRQSYYEMPLLYEHNEGPIVYGKVDQVCITKDQVWVVDYKTSRPPEHHRERFYQELATRYLPQMRCYKEGVAKLFPNKKIKLSLLFTKSGFLYHYPSLDNSICLNKFSGST